VLDKNMMRAVEQFVFKATLPVLYDSPDGLDQVGTGTLFDVRGRLMLVTAGHLFDDREPERFAISRSYVGSHNPRTLGSFDLSRPDNKEIDIAVLVLRDHLTIANARDGWAVLTEENTGVASAQGIFVLSGYPSKRVKVDGANVTGSLITGFTERLPQVPKNAEPPVDPNLDLFFRYDDKVIDVNDKEIPAPDLSGLSGSSIWEYVESPHQKLWMPQATLRVIGVQSAYLQGKYTRAKSWSFVKSMIDRLV